MPLLGCEAIFPRPHQPTDSQQLTTFLPVIQPSPALELSQPGGFNQRYAQWLANFESLQGLLAEFNQLPGINQPVQMQVTTCDGSESLADRSMPTDSLPTDSLRKVQLCYELLSYLSDQFDDLSASPREQQLATLDAVYFLTLRQLSHIALSDYSLPLTPETLDQVTVALPHILNQPSSDTALSGVQWIFNQGHPLGVETGLYQFFESLALAPSSVLSSASDPSTTSPSVSLAALGLENYQRMVCHAYGMAPGLYPYLASEIPETLDLRACGQELTVTLEQWRERLQGDGYPLLPSSVILPPEEMPQKAPSTKQQPTEQSPKG